MKKTYRNISAWCIIILLIMTGISCLKLEEEPKGLSTPDNFYSTPGQCEAAFAASMNTLYNTWEGYENVYGAFPDGQYTNVNLDYGPNYNSMYWQIHYRAINDINAVLKAVIKRNSLGATDPVTVKNIIAQAKFLRAFNYFTLVRLWGKVPFLTEHSPDPISNPLTPESRLEIAAIYDSLEADLDFAIENLEDYDASRPARPNIWLAKTLLAKVYITRATNPLNETSYYAKARDLADDIILHGPFVLLPKFEDVFLSTNKNNLEIIWAFQTTDDDPNIDGVAMAPSEWGGWSGGAVKPRWAEEYPEQPRKKGYILMDFPSDITTDPMGPIINYRESIDGTPYIQKYLWPMITLEEQLNISRQYAPIYRFPDVLLIYAEAANMAGTGPTQLAVDRINMIIDRANTDSKTGLMTGTEPRADITMSQAEFDAKVIRERDLELCFENDRIFDVFRKRLLQEVTVDEEGVPNPDYNENCYLFPIPVNDALDIGQNPGY
ncbi:MAG: RagB/SusD family nutrient uptake outer membrane protein [Bacteroidales bacterium]|jgi:hypothetical protein